VDLGVASYNSNQAKDAKLKEWNSNIFKLVDREEVQLFKRKKRSTSNEETLHQIGMRRPNSSSPATRDLQNNIQGAANSQRS
jgi:hypothetical protein